MGHLSFKVYLILPDLENIIIKLEKASSTVSILYYQIYLHILPTYTMVIDYLLRLLREPAKQQGKNKFMFIDSVDSV